MRKLLFTRSCSFHLGYILVNNSNNKIWRLLSGCTPPRFTCSHEVRCQLCYPPLSLPVAHITHYTLWNSLEVGGPFYFLIFRVTQGTVSQNQWAQYSWKSPNYLEVSEYLLSIRCGSQLPFASSGSSRLSLCFVFQYMLMIHEILFSSIKPLIKSKESKILLFERDQFSKVLSVELRTEYWQTT